MMSLENGKITAHRTVVNAVKSCPEKRSVNVLRSQSLSSVLSCVQLATHPTEYGCNLPWNCATCQNTVLLTKQVCKTI